MLNIQNNFRMDLSMDIDPYDALLHTPDTSYYDQFSPLISDTDRFSMSEIVQVESATLDRAEERPVAPTKAIYELPEGLPEIDHIGKMKIDIPNVKKNKVHTQQRQILSIKKNKHKYNQLERNNSLTQKCHQ